MGYITAARTRARRRQSLWNLLLIPCYLVPWFMLILASLIALGELYNRIHAVSGFGVVPDTFGGILMAVGSLLTWMGPAMIVANLLVASVPPARRALDREGAAFSGTDRPASNHSLLRLSCYLMPTGGALALTGLLIPW